MAASRIEKGPGFTSQALFLGGLIFAVFGLSFWAPFDYDDVLMIVRNPDVTGPWPGWRHFFMTPFSYQENYEPVSLLLHRAAYLVGGLSPVMFRLENLLLHWIACLLVLRLFQELLGPRSPSLWLAALFAVYPSHTENMAIATFKKHILVAICGLAMLLVERPWRESRPSWGRRASCAGFLVLGLFCKENAAVLPAILAAMSLSLAPGWKERLRRDGLFFAGLFGLDLAFLFWRSQVVPRPLGQLVGGSLITHILTAAECLAWYLRELVVPIHLSQEHWIPPLTLAWSWALPATGAALAALAALGAWLWRKDRIAFAGLALAVLWLVPFLNLIPYLNLSLVANRYIYLSMAGVMLCVGSLSRPLWSRSFGRLRAVPLACAGLGLVYAGLATTNLARYSDPVDVWEQAVRAAPGNPRAHAALASLYANRQRYDDADREFRAAIRDGEGSYAISSASQLAMIYAQTGRLRQAGHIYHSLGGRYLTATDYRMLGETFMLEKRWTPALYWFKRALLADPRDTFSRFKLACCYGLTKDNRRAEVQWKSLAGDPLLDPFFAAPAWANLGLIYLKRDRLALAQDAFERSLKANPNQIGVTANLADLYARRGRARDGLKLFERLIASIREGQKTTLESAEDLSASQLRAAAEALPAALAERTRFLAKHRREAASKA